jgi:hypothetical protein
MRVRIVLHVAAAALAAVFLVHSAEAQQRGTYKPPDGKAPRKANGKVDFGGVWETPRMADVTKDEVCCKGVKDLPYTPYGKKQWDDYDASKGDYAGACLPFGLLRSVGGPHPVQIIQDDKYIAMLWEQNSWFHITPIGRPRVKSDEPLWYGNSIARWEGDTLIIDTNQFNGKTRVDTIGHPISDQLHTIEHFKRRDLGHIDYTITIDDPKTYTKPWDSVRIWLLRPDWEIMEYSCEENNKDVRDGHIKGTLHP